MRKKILAFLAALIIVFATAAPAFAEEEPNWRQAYLDYIISDYDSLEYEKDIVTYSLMYIRSDGIPSLYISHGTVAAGGAFCYVDGTEVVTTMMPTISFEYVERSDAYFISGGRMGFYFDDICAFVDGHLESVASGKYGGEYGMPLSRAGEEGVDLDSVNEYKWNDEIVSGDTYRANMEAMYDKYAPAGSDIKTANGYGEDTYTYDEIIEWFVNESGSTTPTTSGVYREASEYRSQLTLNADEGSFVLDANMLHFWGTVSGTYTESSEGIIRCHIEKRNFSDPSGDITDFNLRKEGDHLILLQELWNFWTDRLDYVGSFEVTADSGHGVVTGNAVRFRMGPGTDYEMIWELNKGDAVEITGKSGDWYRVEYSADDLVMTGYMSADYVSKQ